MRSEILIPILFLSFLTISIVIRVYLYYSSISDQKIITVEGVILSHPYIKNGYQNLQISGVNVKTYPFPQYRLGDYVFITPKQVGYSKVLYFPDIEIIDRKNVSLLNSLSVFRSTLISRVKRNMSEPYSGLLLGMTIGYKDDFPEDFLYLLKKTGTIHIIVVSGYNISIVMSSISIIFGFLGKRLHLLFSIIFALLFAGIAGFDPSVVRATIMGLVTVIGAYYGSQRFPLYVLYSTLVLMIIVNPAYLFDISFQLSAVATFGVVVCSILENEKESIFSFMFMTIFVSLFIFPIISYYFETVSIISILSNLLVAWVIPFITIGGFLFLMFPVLLLKIVLIFFIDLYLVLIKFFGNFTIGYINYKFSIAGIFLYYFILLVIYLIIYKWVRYFNE